MTSHNNHIPTCHEYLAKVTRRYPLNPLPQPEHMAHVTNMWCACIPCVYIRVCVCVRACMRVCGHDPTFNCISSSLQSSEADSTSSFTVVAAPPLDSEYLPNYTQGHTETYRHTDTHAHMYACTHTCTQDMHTRHVHPLMYALHSYIRSSCIVPSTVYASGSNHWIVRQPGQANRIDQVCVTSSDCCHS